jgi:hypothetical protein
MRPGGSSKCDREPDRWEAVTFREHASSRPTHEKVLTPSCGLHQCHPFRKLQTEDVSGVSPSRSISVRCVSDICYTLARSGLITRTEPYCCPSDRSSEYRISAPDNCAA